MNDQELRLACLQMASVGTRSWEDTIAAAQKLYDFVMSKASAPKE